MKMNPKARIRKMVRGYKLMNKVAVDQEIYDATIVKTAAATWTVTITNKAKEVVSLDDAATLALAIEMMKGQLVDLGARFPVKSPTVVAIVPPVEPDVYTLAITQANVVGDDVTFDVVATLNGDPLENATVSIYIDDVLSAQGITDSNGEASILASDVVQGNHVAHATMDPDITSDDENFVVV